MAEEFPDRLLTAAQVAELYSVEEHTIIKWAIAGRIPAPQKQRPKYTRWLLSTIIADIRGGKEAELQEAAS